MSPSRHRWAAAVVAASAGIVPAGCGAGSSSSHSTTSASASTPTTSSGQISHTAPAPAVRLARGFHLTSPAFRPGGAIPKRYTCDGADVSPPLRFAGVPRGTRELVLIMRDPDARSGNFVHWAIAGVPPATTGLQQGGVPGQIIPGRNSFGRLGYRGPCPPGGQTHHYVITLNALGGRSGLKPGFTADELQTAAIGVATLIGTYRRG